MEPFMYKQIGYCGALLFTACLAGQDIRRQKISVTVLLLSAALSLLYLAAGRELTRERIAGGLIPGMLLMALSFLTGENIGYGDGAAVLALGLWTGGAFCMGAAALGIILTGLSAVYLLVRRAGKTIPFLPFLLAAMEVMFFYA